MFPIQRCRRLRKSNTIRSLVRETSLSLDKLIYPLFVVPGKGVKREITSMPGCYQQSIDNIINETRELLSLGIQGIILFGIPDTKDPKGSSAYADNGIIQNAVKSIKDAVPSMLVITDVCLCEYTSHGHCGIVEESDVNNDKTLDLLTLQAVSHAKAGADIVAPSDMMDGRIMKIREALDDWGFENLPIMSYSAKYASAFYGPFRDAAESAPKFGDRKTYQMDPANRREALKEVALDIEEGADIVMVKPALSYLDVISDIKSTFDVPVSAYNVSGEYSMVKAAGQHGWIDEQKIMIEILTSIKRAGADIIITYFAKDYAMFLDN